MERDGSLPCAQQPATGPYPDPDFYHSVSLRSLLRLELPSGLFPSGIPQKILYTFLIFPMHVTCPTYLIIVDVFTLIIFGEACKL